MNRNRLYLAAAAVTVASVLAAGLWLVSANKSNDRFASCREGSVAGGNTTIGGPFTLVDETGQTVTDKEVFSRPALVYFGYTFCPDVCPLDVARNADAVDLLQDRGLDIRPVFITIDPARDTPEVLAEYTDIMHPDMLGLTGSEEQVKVASQAYKTYFERQDGDDFYLMDHTSISYLVLPETGFENFYRRDETPEDLAASAGCFLNKLG